MIGVSVIFLAGDVKSGEDDDTDHIHNIRVFTTCHLGVSSSGCEPFFLPNIWSDDGAVSFIRGE